MGYINCWRKYARFRGRSGRLEFWSFILIHYAILAGYAAVTWWALLPREWVADPEAVYPLRYYTTIWLSIAVAIYTVLSLTPGMAAGCRRLHDRGLSGWWQLTLLIPGLGLAALGVIWALPSQPGANRYGPRPGVE